MRQRSGRQLLLGAFAVLFAAYLGMVGIVYWGATKDAPPPEGLVEFEGRLLDVSARLDRSARPFDLLLKVEKPDATLWIGTIWIRPEDKKREGLQSNIEAISALKGSTVFIRSNNRSVKLLQSGAKVHFPFAN